jgi:RNA methyltransferase, TrmH family
MSSPPRDRLRPVSSRQNALVKELRQAFAHGGCSDDGWCAIESVRIIEEAVRSGLRFRAVIFSESARDRAERLLPQISSHAETIVVPDAVFAGAVATETPQGVAALVRVKTFTIDDILRQAPPLVVVAAGLQDPGNMGTVVRSAEAFGAGGVIATEKTVSHLNPKSVRASAGSVFRVPVISMSSEQVISALRARGLRLYGTSSHKGTRLDEADLTGAAAIMIGNEGAGLPRNLLAATDETIAIPQARAESLNAAVAASIILYEAARQRRGE